MVEEGQYGRGLMVSTSTRMDMGCREDWFGLLIQIDGSSMCSRIPHPNNGFRVEVIAMTKCFRFQNENDNSVRESCRSLRKLDINLRGSKVMKLMDYVFVSKPFG